MISAIETFYMKKTYCPGIALLLLFFTASSQPNEKNPDILIGKGQLPNIAADKNGSLHVVYGTGDSILYSVSANGGESFSAPVLIAALPQLAAFAMRGPQIAITKEGPLVTACTKQGNIFSYKKNANGKWQQTARVNDVDTVAKEMFMALGADGNQVFAAWLDLRNNKRNKIVGALSKDGGKTWLKNSILYASPDSSVCECCKPSVAVKGNHVYVMFRNWLQGNRDLYLLHSADAGKSFAAVQKLGVNSWKLNGCPMDGGGLAINDKDAAETVWRRNNTIYSCRPGEAETAIGEGRGCTIETVNGHNVYAWSENGQVVVLTAQGNKKTVGKGQLPALKKISNKNIVCVWENEHQVYAHAISL